MTNRSLRALELLGADTSIDAGEFDAYKFDLAYSAQGGVGTVIVDVGSGKFGGSLKNPKLINTFPIQSGHEIYPYFQKATGRYSGARLVVKKVVTNHQGEGTKFVYESQLTEGLAEK